MKEKRSATSMMNNPGKFFHRGTADKQYRLLAHFIRAYHSETPTVTATEGILRMRISLILAYPTPGSLNYAIADAAREALLALGHQVDYHDLYGEEFDPMLPTAEIPKHGSADPEIQRYCDEIAVADGIIIVHPNWWGMPLAILTGWVDRVIRPSVAYEFLEGDSGEGVPRGLLKAQSALIFNTANTSATREELVFGNPLESIWKRCICINLCGVSDVHRVMFRIVVTSTPEQREA